MVLEDQTLMHLARREDVLAILPFLRTLKDALDKAGGCSPCAKNRLHSSALQNIKTSMVGLSSADWSKLSDLLQAKHFRIIYKNAQNQVISQTFPA